MRRIEIVSAEVLRKGEEKIATERTEKTKLRLQTPAPRDERDSRRRPL